MRCEGKEYPLLSLGSFSDMKYGKMPKKDTVKENGKYPVFSGYRIVGYCDECNLDKQQLIVVARGVGGTGDVKLSPGACFLTNLSIAVIIDENIALKQYLFYYFQKHNLRYLDSGSAQSQITIADLKNTVLPIPPLEIQSKIVEILSSFDDKIELNNKINDNLFEMVNAYYTSLFKGGKCEMTSIGKYAERIYSGGTPATSNAAYWDGAFGWFSSGETRNRFVISTEKTITQAGIDNSSTKLAAKYDIVMASAGQGFTRGQTSMLLIDTYVNQSVIVIHAERNVLPYLFWNLANRYEELRAISDSSSIRGSLTTKMIATFEIPRANKESLQAFADFSWSVIPQIENNLLENERLIALRDTLLPKLMSGEIDVSNIQL